MKFSIIFKTVLFSLFTFIATATYAANTMNPTTSNEEVQLNEEENGSTIITVTGRVAEVRDENDRMRGSAYMMTIKLIKGEKVLMQRITNESQISLDFSEFDEGLYILDVETPSGVERQTIRLN